MLDPVRLRIAKIVGISVPILILIVIALHIFVLPNVHPEGEDFYVAEQELQKCIQRSDNDSVAGFIDWREHECTLQYAAWHMYKDDPDLAIKFCIKHSLYKDYRHLDVDPAEKCEQAIRGTIGFRDTE